MRTAHLVVTLLGVNACHRAPAPVVEPAPAPGPRVPADPAPSTSSAPQGSSLRQDSLPPPRGITGTWAGTYFYLDGATQPPVYFFADLELSGQTLTGHIVEPNTFVDGPQTELHSVVRGVVGDDGTIAFLKQYDGSAGVTHTVAYEGHLDESRTRAEGHWEIRGQTGGTFVMARQARRSGLARAPSPSGSSVALVDRPHR